MNLWLCNLGNIAAITALLLAAGNLAAKAPAGPNIAPSSCGGVAVPPSGNAFCSFEGDGSGVVIGHHSCNVIGGCLLVGNGVRIGNDSCNGDTACAGLGELGGSAVVGNGSCNGDFACNFTGSEGTGDIGNNSCNGPAEDGFGEPLGVCYGVGASGGSGRIGNDACKRGLCLLARRCRSFGQLRRRQQFVQRPRGLHLWGQNGGIGVIGNDSCNATRSCFDNAQEAGSISRIGNGSCNELSSCSFAGDFGANSVIGNKSCNGSYACQYAGLFDPDSPSVIGNHSCNGAANLSDPDVPVGICDSNVGTIGNNKNNAP